MHREVILVLAAAAAASAASIEATIDSPDGSISGLGWENGVLWAVDTEITTGYGIDPVTGNVTVSLDIEYIPGYEAYGLAVSNDTLFICQLKYGGPDSYYCYHSAVTGAYLAGREKRVLLVRHTYGEKQGRWAMPGARHITSPSRPRCLPRLSKDSVLRAWPSRRASSWKNPSDATWLRPGSLTASRCRCFRKTRSSASTTISGKRRS